jgi:hypothetical protein
MVGQVGVAETLPKISEVPETGEPEPAATESVEEPTVRDILAEPPQGQVEGDRHAEPVEPPKRFVLDPLHPATQLLRGLALDYDPDADDLPSSTLGRRGRTR